MQSGSFELRSGNLAVRLAGNEHGVNARLEDAACAAIHAAGPYRYRVTTVSGTDLTVSDAPREIALDGDEREIALSARLGVLKLAHVLRVAETPGGLDETLTLTNDGETPVTVDSFAAGFLYRIADDAGNLLHDFEASVVAPVPFMVRPGLFEKEGPEIPLATALATRGGSQRSGFRWRYGHLPSDGWLAEGWMWRQREDSALAVFKFNQDAVEFSYLAFEPFDGGVYLRFGGAAFSALERREQLELAPARSVTFGLTHYRAVKDGYRSACYAHRGFLDGKGCRFPGDYDPHVQWNELYDNPELSTASPGKPALNKHSGETRPYTYSRDIIFGEAEKAVAYGCQSLYLDPGWDTEFGSLVWGEAWLGPQEDFVAELEKRYGLSLALHFALAPWASSNDHTAFWPDGADSIIEDLACASDSKHTPKVCFGSRTYLEATLKRALLLCERGAHMLLFDGNCWYGDCASPEHGHPVPYTMAAHVDANMWLATEIHRLCRQPFQPQ